MIEIKEQYNNVYLKITTHIENFDEILEKVRSIPVRAFNKETSEWMFPSSNLDTIKSIFKKYLEPEDCEFEFKCSLYPFQETGAKFLLKNNFGAIFDSCGLGKTPQLIAASSKIIKDTNKKALIVTLSSLKKQWEKEIEKFTDFKALAVNGTNQIRKKQIMDFLESDYSFMVINYEMLRNEEYVHLIHQIDFQVVCLDEAQKIKTGVTDKKLRLKPSQNAAGAFSIKSIPHRYIATATPVQGKAEEIFSLFYFLDENILGQWEKFKSKYCKFHWKYGITGYKEMKDLYENIKPYFIRRTKNTKEVQQQLPALQHSHIFLQMETEQEKIHNHLLEKIQDLKEESKISGSKFINGKTMNEEEVKQYYDNLMQGYQIFLIASCDDPMLLFKSESNIAKKIIDDLEINQKNISSPKLETLKQFVEDTILNETESKVVIFTRFERMAQIIHESIPNSVVFHGKMNEDQKQNSIQQFKENPFIKVFVSTDAGSTGLNLQVANYMVHFDLPWDPTLIEQRNGRIDRTGSKFSNATIYYYVMSDSFDEQLLNIIQKKSELASQIIEGGKSSVSKQQDPNLLAIERMLKNKNKKK